MTATAYQIKCANGAYAYCLNNIDKAKLSSRTHSSIVHHFFTTLLNNNAKGICAALDTHSCKLKKVLNQYAVPLIPSLKTGTSHEELIKLATKIAKSAKAHLNPLSSDKQFYAVMIDTYAILHIKNLQEGLAKRPPDDDDSEYADVKFCVLKF